MKRLTFVAIAILVATVAVAATGASAATTSGTPLVAEVPVTGTAADGGAFTGTMAIESLAVQDGRLLAIGTVSGTSVDPAGNATEVSDSAFAQPAQVTQQQEGCSLVSLTIGAFDLGVAGTIAVHLDPIAVDVRLEGLVGALVCGLLGGGLIGAPAPAPATG